MDGVVVFDPEDFKARYPEFASFPDAALETVFDAACMLVDNTPASVVPLRNDTPPKEPRKTLLYLAMAHTLELKNRGMGTVGTVTGAAQGSANVSFGSTSADTDDAFWAQTNYGRLFLRSSLPYRLGVLYVSAD